MRKERKRSRKTETQSSDGWGVVGSPSHTVSTSESEPVLQVSATPYTRYPQRGSATVVGVSSEGPRVAHLEAHVSLTEAGRARVKPTDLSEEFPTSVS